MSTPQSVKTQIQSLIDTANETTGNNDATLTDAVGALVDGYGSGEGSGEVKESPNLFVYPYNSFMVNGVECVDNRDGSFTLNGTVQGMADISFTTDQVLINGETYILDLGISDELYQNFEYVEIRGFNDNEGVDFKVPFKAEVSSDCLNLLVLIPDGTVLDNVTFYPNLNKGTELKPWQPYIEPEFYFTAHGIMYRKNHVIPTGSYESGFCSLAYWGAVKMETVEAPYYAHRSADGSVFQGCTALKRAYFPRLYSCTNSFFSGCVNLTDVTLGCEEYPMVNLAQTAFSGCSNLTNLTYIGTISTTLYLHYSYKLTNESVQNVIDALVDLTGKTPLKIVLHNEVVARMSEEQKAAITSKNWTLVASS